MVKETLEISRESVGAKKYYLGKKSFSNYVDKKSWVLCIPTMSILVKVYNVEKVGIHC